MIGGFGMRTVCAGLVFLLGLSGCGGMQPEDFAGREPRLVLEDYFAGRSQAWGIFQDRFGTLRRQFEVEIEGTWDGETLTLVEDFLYDDGETEQRVWRITKLGDHDYEGRAADVIGTAQGKAYGNALNWTYTFALKVDEDTWRVRFDDWMFLQSDGVLINRAEVSKFGIKIGEVTIAFRQVRDLPTEGSDVARPTLGIEPAAAAGRAAANAAKAGPPAPNGPNDR